MTKESAKFAVRNELSPGIAVCQNLYCRNNGTKAVSMDAIIRYADSFVFFTV